MNAGWVLKSEGPLRWFELPLSDRLLLAFTTRDGGVSPRPYATLNASFDVGDQVEHVTENRLRIRQSLRLPALATLRQVHGDGVVPVCYDRTPSGLIEGDALFTSETGLGLGIMVADCLPVYLFAADLRCVGLAHCGWRGTAHRIAEKLARTMSRRNSIPLSELRFALGPCICPDCLTVGDDVWQEFSAYFPAPEKFLPSSTDSRGRPVRLLDIRAANRRLLRDMGLTEVGSLNACTKEESDQFYSVRRERTTGRNLGIVALR